MYSENFKLSFSYIFHLSYFLSSNFHFQEDKLGYLMDDITIDIAEEWDYKSLVRYINIMKKEIQFDNEIINLFKKIDFNFIDISIKSKNYKPELWTIEAFEKSEFWNNQRENAKIIFEYLNSLNVDQKYKNLDKYNY